MEHLHALGAVDKRFMLTAKGRKMADFPLAPIYASMLLRSAEFNCTEVCSFSSIAELVVRQPVAHARSIVPCAMRRVVVLKCHGGGWFLD